MISGKSWNIDPPKAFFKLKVNSLFGVIVNLGLLIRIIKIRF